MISENEKEVFVIQQYGSSGELDRLITSAIARANGVSVRFDQSVYKSGSLKRDFVISALETADLIIADVSDALASVMFELGIARALDKPLIVVARSGFEIPSEIWDSIHIIYDHNNPEDFVHRLENLVFKAFKDPDSFKYQQVAEVKKQRKSIFVSYSHTDREYLSRLLVHLKPLERDGLINLWEDSKLRAGDRWRQEIEKALSKSNIAILLVSADFLASDFIVNNELQPLLKSAESDGLKIIPIIVKPCRYVRDNNLNNFQSLNDPKRALILLTEGERELEFDRLAQEIEKHTAK